jgi:hypothetical protein
MIFGMKEIRLTNGKVAIVDDEDFLYLSRFRWKLGSTGHAVMTGGTSSHCWTVYMEEFIKEKPRSRRYFFVNQNPLDLRKNNIELRTFANHSIGQGKCRIKKTSVYRGVCWDKRYNCWCAYVNWKNFDKNKRERALKYFKDEKEAAVWRNEKAVEIFGEFAYQNPV